MPPWVAHAPAGRRGPAPLPAPDGACVHGLGLPRLADRADPARRHEPVRHFGLQFEATRLVSYRALVKLLEDVLGPPAANKSVSSVTVYSSSIPFYLHSLVPEEDALKQFRQARDFPIEWSDDADLMGIPGLLI